MCVTNVHLGISWHVGHYCSSWVSQLIRNIDYLLSLAACIVYYAMTKASPQRGGIHVRSLLSSLSPEFEVHCYHQPGTGNPGQQQLHSKQLPLYSQISIAATPYQRSFYLQQIPLSTHTHTPCQNARTIDNGVPKFNGYTCKTALRCTAQRALWKGRQSNCKSQRTIKFAMRLHLLEKTGVLHHW